MADLDSTSKRRSSVQLLRQFAVSPPLPDGTLNQGDRQHVAATYSGIAAASVADWVQPDQAHKASHQAMVSM